MTDVVFAAFPLFVFVGWVYQDRRKLAPKLPGHASFVAAMPFAPFRGPLAMTLMFRLASSPMIETRIAGRREGWGEHARRVPLVFPWPPRRQS